MRYILPVILLCVSVLFSGEPVSGIVLTTDRTVNVTSNQGIIDSILDDTMNPQQKAYTLWRFFIQRNMHKEGAKLSDHGNAAQLMTNTAYSLCGSWGHHYAGLATDAGLTASNVYLNGHVVAAVRYWDDWHMIDADMWVLYPDADGIIASPAAIKDSKNPDGTWTYRTGPPTKTYPWYMGPDTLQGVAGMYDKAKVNHPYKKHDWKWEYNLSLRPGMEIIWSWYPDPDIGFVSLDHVPDVRNPRKHPSLDAYLEDTYDYYARKDGKPAMYWGGRRGGLRPNPLQEWNGTGGNGRLICDLRYTLESASRIQNIESASGAIALQNPHQEGQIELAFELPYQFGDAFFPNTLSEDVIVELIRPEKPIIQVFPQGAVDDGKRIRLYNHIRGFSSFTLRFTIAANSDPIPGFKAVGVFHHAWTALPALLKGKNTIQMQLADPSALERNPLYVTYTYNQVADNREIYRHGMHFTFTPQALSWGADTGDKHWPLMRSIQIRCGGPAPAETDPVLETEERDWGAYPWDWVYHGVNFWNDFERGDRQGWRGELTTARTSGGSDFALDNNLMHTDGTRQLKMIRHGAFLNKDSHFRCRLYIENVESLRFYSRNQADRTYPEITITDLKNGQWQDIDIAFNDLKYPNDPKRKMQGGEFMSSQYLVVKPLPDAANQDVVFIIDDIICYDGELKYDPFKDENAHIYALGDDPIWSAFPSASGN